MSKNSKIITTAGIVIIFIGSFLWQYFASIGFVNKNYKPMIMEITLEPLSGKALDVARNSRYVYLGSSDKKIVVKEIRQENQEGRISLILEDTGIIYPDSAFFAGQRLVYNTKLNIHALFDAVGTVKSLEYSK